MTNLRWPDKDPSDYLDFQLDWTARLAKVNDTVSVSAWTVEGDDSALLIGAAGGYVPTFTPLTTTVWLSAGTAGCTYTITNTMTTTNGRVFQRSVELRVRDR